MSTLTVVMGLLVLLAMCLYWRLRNPLQQRDLVLVVTLLGLALWDVRLLGLLLGLSWVTWATARQTERWESDAPERRDWLFAGLGGALGTLLALKAMGFFGASLVALFARQGFEPSWPMLTLLVPIGLTIPVLQAIRYCVDVHWGDVRPARTLRQVASFILFFPGLAAGPIMPAAALFNQLKAPKQLSRNQANAALRALAVGFVFKVVLADHFGRTTDPVFADPGEWTNLAVFGASLAVGAQVFFDVCGCALISVGVARALGFAIPDPFRFPIGAPNLRDAVTRVHPTLTAWATDYVTRPLAEVRPNDPVHYQPLVAVGTLGVFWAMGTSLLPAWIIMLTIMTILHQFLFRDPDITLPQPVGIAATMAIIVFAMPLLRSETLADAMAMMAALLGERTGGPNALGWTVWSAPILLTTAYWLGSGRLPSPDVHSGLRTPVMYWAGLGAMVALALAFFPLGKLAGLA
ncbi:MAG: hypothetical protein AAGJ32_05785 [Pseudomonadota bacterium]